MQMIRIWRSQLGAFGLVLALATMSPHACAQSSKNDDFHDKLMQIGTGPSGGSFGPIGETLCETMNKVRPSTLVRCVLWTKGERLNHERQIED